MARKKMVDLKIIEEDIRSKFDLVQKMTEDPSSIKKPTKAVKTIFESIRQYKTDALKGSITAYKVFKINGYDMQFSNLTNIVKNRLRAYASLPLEKLSVA